jgi:hypothetical protein
MKIVRIILLILVFSLAASVFRPVHAAISADILQEAAYPDSLGFEHIIGVVKNTGDVWIQFVRITTVLYAQNGTILDALSNYTQPSKVPPAGITAFDNIETNRANAKAVSRVESTVQAETSGAMEVDLTIMNPSGSLDSLGFMEVVGTVKNNGTQPSTFTKIVGIFYDGSRNLTYVNSTFTSPDTIPPGAQYSFKLILSDKNQSSATKTVTLLAESDQYSSVPEFPWPAILLASAILLEVVTVRRRDR